MDVIIQPLTFGFLVHWGGKTRLPNSGKEAWHLLAAWCWGRDQVWRSDLSQLPEDLPSPKPCGLGSLRRNKAKLSHFHLAQRTSAGKRRNIRTAGVVRSPGKPF